MFSWIGRSYCHLSPQLFPSFNIQPKIPTVHQDLTPEMAFIQKPTIQFVFSWLPAAFISGHAKSFPHLSTYTQYWRHAHEYTHIQDWLEDVAADIFRNNRVIHRAAIIKKDAGACMAAKAEAAADANYCPLLDSCCWSSLTSTHTSINPSDPT